MRKLLTRLFKRKALRVPEREPRPTVIAGPSLSRGGVRGTPVLLDVDADDPPPLGEPAPAEASEAAWEHEREQRERDGC